METAYGLMGLGCNCQGYGSMGLRGVDDYDIIIIGGKQYSANQILDKTIVASKDITLYPSLFNDTGKFVVKAGQPIGKAFSYLLPSSKSNPTGRVVLQFENGYNKYFWLKDDRAVSQNSLQQQGTQTVQQEIKDEQEKQQKENDPVGYYLKKYGLPTLLIIGGILIAKEAVPALIDKAVPQRKPAMAMAGHKKKKKRN